MDYLLVHWDTWYCVKFSIDDPAVFYKLSNLHQVEFFTPGIGKFVRKKFSKEAFLVLIKQIIAKDVHKPLLLLTCPNFIMSCINKVNEIMKFYNDS